MTYDFAITFGVPIVIGILVIYLGFIKFDKFSIEHGPEILTTLGIFGCFLGVAISLYSLDANPGQLTKSIPLLFAGLKTAFIGSLFGVAGALIIRFRQYFKRNLSFDEEGSSKEADTGDLIVAIKSLHKGLVGTEEGTLLTQFKLQRQETADQLTKLRESFDNFSKHMVENNQKAVIEALKEVIKDFNNQLMEQFGENFKQLNMAVGDLVKWQQQYKEELDLIKTAIETRMLRNSGYERPIRITCVWSRTPRTIKYPLNLTGQSSTFCLTS